MAKITAETIEKEAAELVRREKNSWEDATAFITEKVAFQMRELIRTLRKNYWGVFDSPRDPITGQKKIWAPLTESLVESVVKNIDLDAKDINFRAKSPKGYGSAQIARLAVKDHLNRMYFGEKLDQLERQIAIDGTAVWKTFKHKGKDGKDKLMIRNVDLLNFYIDPTAESIQETAAVIERSVLDINDFKSYDGWNNKDGIEGKTDLSRNDANNRTLARSEAGETKYVEVFERWGLMPKWLITGKDADKKSGELVEGVIVVSFADTNPVVHKIEENKDGLKPYEECWYTRVQGRWYGRGIAEKVMMLQVWMNTVINIRRNKNHIGQLGLFKVKKGSGITPQMLGKLGSNGAISVSAMDDIQQMVVDEAAQSSYQDEANVQSWAQRVTSAFEVVTGESLPASTPATNAVLQDRNAKSGFTLVKEGVGMFIQRWMDRHALPVISSMIKKEDIIRLTDEDNLADMVERVVLFEAEKKLAELLDEGMLVDPEEMQQAIEDSIAKLKKNKGMFIKVTEKILSDEIDTQVFVTNEELDTAVVVQNLQSILSVAPEYKDQIISQTFDLMGLPEPKKPQQQLPQQAQPGAQPSPQDLQQITQQSNLPTLNA